MRQPIAVPLITADHAHLASQRVLCFLAQALPNLSSICRKLFLLGNESECSQIARIKVPTHGYVPDRRSGQFAPRVARRALEAVSSSLVPRLVLCLWSPLNCWQKQVSVNQMSDHVGSVHNFARSDSISAHSSLDCASARCAASTFYLEHDLSCNERCSNTNCGKVTTNT